MIENHVFRDMAVFTVVDLHPLGLASAQFFIFFHKRTISGSSHHPCESNESLNLNLQLSATHYFILFFFSIVDKPLVFKKEEKKTSL